MKDMTVGRIEFGPIVRIGSTDTVPPLPPGWTFQNINELCDVELTIAGETFEFKGMSPFDARRMLVAARRTDFVDVRLTRGGRSAFTVITEGVDVAQGTQD